MGKKGRDIHKETRHFRSELKDSNVRSSLSCSLPLVSCTHSLLLFQYLEAFGGKKNPASLFDQVSIQHLKWGQQCG